METSPQEHILFIVSDQDVLAPLFSTLTKEGYTNITMATAREGLDMALAHKPDLVVIDFFLPDKEGLDVCRQIKSVSAPCSPPVVLYSIHPSSAEDRAVGLDLGADAAICEPVDHRELAAHIRSLLRTWEEKKRLERQRQSLETLLHSIQEKEQLLKMKVQQGNLYDLRTELPNHQLFLDRLQQALSLAERHEHKVGLIFVDLNDFEHIATQYGRQIGDKLLHQAGQRILGCVRKSDTLAQYDQDKFAVIAAKVDYAEGIQKVAEKMNMGMHDPFLLGGHCISVQVSMGLGMFPDDADNPQDLIRIAIQNMYRAQSDPEHDFIASE